MRNIFLTTILAISIVASNYSFAGDAPLKETLYCFTPSNIETYSINERKGVLSKYFNLLNGQENLF